MDCDEVCFADAGPSSPAPSDEIEVTPSALEVGIGVAPSAPNAAMWEGFSMLTVTVRNPASYRVVVWHDSVSDDKVSTSFVYQLSNPSEIREYGRFMYGPEARRFAPGETKRFILDLPRSALEPGVWSFAGIFDGARSTSSVTFTVEPKGWLPPLTSNSPSR